MQGPARRVPGALAVAPALARLARDALSVVAARAYPWTEDRQRRGSRRRNDELREVFDSVTDQIYLLEIDTGRVVDMNRAALAYWGVSRADLVPTGQPDWWAEAEKAGSQPFELQATRPGGGAVWLEVRVVPATVQGVERRVAVVRDITDRKAVEAKLAESREQFRAAFEDTPTGAAIIDTDGRFRVVNDALVAMLRRPREELIGHVVGELLHPDDRERATGTREGMLAGRAPAVRTEFRFRRGDGSYAHIATSASLVGAPADPYIVAHYVDVSDLRRAQADLGESEERFRIAFEQAPFGMMVLDPVLRVQRANRAALAILRREPAEVEGRVALEFLAARAVETGEDVEPADHPVARIRSEPGSTRIFQRRIVRGDGTEGIVEGGVTAALGPAGEVVYVLGQFADVTERVTQERRRAELEEQLRVTRGMEAIGRLAGGVAHDFNNMLSIILNYADILAAAAPDDRTRQGLRAIRTAADRCAELTRRLMILGRRDTVRSELVDPNGAAAEVERVFAPVLGDGVTLRLFLEHRLHRVRIPASHLEEAVTCLVTNARDAIEGQGEIVVQSRNVQLDDPAALGWPDLAPGPYVELSVADTGRGMTPEAAARAFEPFFTTRQGSGARGLGLSLVYGVVTDAGGRVRIGANEGRGTRVEILLPAAAAAAEGPVGLAGPSARGHGEVIVVVEDEPALRELVAELLRQAGYQVHAFPDGQAALEWIEGRGGPIHLVLTDVVMPRMTGPELAKRVAGRGGIRVAFMSGHTDQRLHREAVRRGEIPLIPKPFDAHKLFAFVRSVLD